MAEDKADMKRQNATRLHKIEDQYPKKQALPEIHQNVQVITEQSEDQEQVILSDVELLD